MTGTTQHVYWCNSGMSIIGVTKNILIRFPHTQDVTHTWHHFWVKNLWLGAGEMAQWVRAPDCSSEGPKFKSQQPHGGSQPPVMGSDALFWCVFEDSYSVFI